MDITKKFPARYLRDDKTWVFYWQCAYVDALDTHDVLRGDIFAKLNNYDFRDRRYARKEYLSADRAINDLVQAFNS